MTQLAARPAVEVRERDRTAGWMFLLLGIVLGALATFGAMQLVGSDSTTRTVVDNWMAAIEAHDLEALVPLYAEDAAWYDQALGDQFSGHDGVRRGWGIFGLFGFEVLDLEAVSIDEQGAVVRWTLAGSSSPFNGRPWESTGVSVLVIEDGLITAETVYYDSRDVQ